MPATTPSHMKDTEYGGGLGAVHGSRGAISASTLGNDAMGMKSNSDAEEAIAGSQGSARDETGKITFSTVLCPKALAFDTQLVSSRDDCIDIGVIDRKSGLDHLIILGHENNGAQIIAKENLPLKKNKLNKKLSNMRARCCDDGRRASVKEITNAGKQKYYRVRNHYLKGKRSLPSYPRRRCSVFLGHCLHGYFFEVDQLSSSCEVRLYGSQGCKGSKAMGCIVVLNHAVVFVEEAQVQVKIQATSACSPAACDRSALSPCKLYTGDIGGFFLGSWDSVPNKLEWIQSEFVNVGSEGKPSRIRKHPCYCVEEKGNTGDKSNNIGLDNQRDRGVLDSYFFHIRGSEDPTLSSLKMEYPALFHAIYGHLYGQLWSDAKIEHSGGDRSSRQSLSEGDEIKSGIKYLFIECITSCQRKGKIARHCPIAPILNAPQKHTRQQEDNFVYSMILNPGGCVYLRDVMESIRGGGSFVYHVT